MKVFEVDLDLQIRCMHEMNAKPIVVCCLLIYAQTSCKDSRENSNSQVKKSFFKDIQTADGVVEATLEENRKIWALTFEDLNRTKLFKFDLSLIKQYYKDIAADSQGESGLDPKALILSDGNQYSLGTKIENEIGGDWQILRSSTTLAALGSDGNLRTSFIDNRKKILPILSDEFDLIIAHRTTCPCKKNELTKKCTKPDTCGGLSIHSPKEMVRFSKDLIRLLRKDNPKSIALISFPRKAVTEYSHMVWLAFYMTRTQNEVVPRVHYYKNAKGQVIGFLGISFSPVSI